MKIGITGSLSSGKTSVAKILSKNKKHLFSADKIVQELYRSKKFKKRLAKKFGIRKEDIKNEIKKKLLAGNISLNSLGKFIHPFVRKKMKTFYNSNKDKILFFEIPLLIESKLLKMEGFMRFLIHYLNSIILQEYVAE